MKTRSDDVARLLDAVAATDAESVRAGALRRLAALRHDERERRRAAVPAETVAAALGASRVARAGSAATPALVRFVASVAHWGVAARDGRTPNDGATAFARALLSTSADALGRSVEGLGRAHAAYLCRDLDTPSAARLARRLGDERAELVRFARLLPAKDDATLRAACRRLATAGGAVAGGADLTEALGRALCSDLLAGADAVYEAAVRRVIGIARSDRDAFDAAWVEIARAVVAHEAERCRA